MLNEPHLVNFTLNLYFYIIVHLQATIQTANNGLSAGVIAGIVLTCVLAMIGLIGLLVFYKIKTKGKYHHP